MEGTLKLRSSQQKPWQTAFARVHQDVLECFENIDKPVRDQKKPKFKYNLRRLKKVEENREDNELHIHFAAGAKTKKSEAEVLQLDIKEDNVRFVWAEILKTWMAGTSDKQTLPMPKRAHAALKQAFDYLCTRCDDKLDMQMMRDAATIESTKVRQSRLKELGSKEEAHVLLARILLFEDSRKDFSEFEENLCHPKTVLWAIRYILCQISTPAISDENMALLERAASVEDIRRALINIPQLHRNVLEYIISLVQKCAQTQKMREEDCREFVDMMCIKSKKSHSCLLGEVLVSGTCQKPERLLPILLRLAEGNIDEMFGGLPLDQEMEDEADEPDEKMPDYELEDPGAEEMAGNQPLAGQPIRVETCRVFERQLQEKLKNVENVKEAREILNQMQNRFHLVTEEMEKQEKRIKLRRTEWKRMEDEFHAQLQEKRDSLIVRNNQLNALQKEMNDLRQPITSTRDQRRMSIPASVFSTVIDSSKALANGVSGKGMSGRMKGIIDEMAAKAGEGWRRIRTGRQDQVQEMDRFFEEANLARQQPLSISSVAQTMQLLVVRAPLAMASTVWRLAKGSIAS